MMQTRFSGLRAAVTVAVALALVAPAAAKIEDFTGDFTQVFGAVHVDPWHKAHCAANVEGCAYKCHYNEGCIAFRMTGPWACQFFFEPRADLGGFEPETLRPSAGTYVLKAHASAAATAVAVVVPAHIEAAGVRLRGTPGASAAADAAADSNSSLSTVQDAAAQDAAEEPQSLGGSPVTNATAEALAAGSN